MTNNLFPTLDMGFVLLALGVINKLSRNFSVSALALRYRNRIESGERVKAANNFIRIVSADESDIYHTLMHEYNARNAQRIAEYKRRNEEFLNYLKSIE